MSMGEAERAQNFREVLGLGTNCAGDTPEQSDSEARRRFCLGV